MKTWEIIKELETSKKPFGSIVYETKDSEGIMFCYLRPVAGSLEFLYWNKDTNEYDHNPIVYMSSEWNITDKEIPIKMLKEVL